MPSLSQRFHDAIAQSPGLKRFVIAFSGGVDSCVLLHLLKQRFPDQPMLAVHVNHQLQADAPTWQSHCQTVCDALNVPLHQEIIRVDTVAGDSLEARARELRYQVFANYVGEHDCLLTAHHQDDQAETLLLQLLRGAGPHGLAAMPVIAEFGKGYHVRPLLNVTRDEIHVYAQQHGLQWVEDHSNADTAFDRNYLRHEIIPRLKQRWPAAAATLSRSARLSADAAHLLDDRAGQWLEQAGVKGTAPLPLASFKSLKSDDCRNVLRYWLHQAGLPLPSYGKLHAIVQEVIQARDDAQPLLKWSDVELRRYAGALYVMRSQVAHDSHTTYHWQAVDWRKPTPLALRGIGILSTQVITEGGVDPQRIAHAELQVRFRQGGERCRQHGHAHTQSIKHLMQQWHIPPWLRDRVPLIYNGDELVCVVGYCVCEGYQSGRDQPGLLFRVEATETAGESG